MHRENFIADLHIHSKFSRATARTLDLEHLHLWAQLKGIRVVGTGDFTHPEWFSQIVEKLEPAEPGLYRLKSALAHHWDAQVPRACKAPVRFMLSCEISNIYKKKKYTRKNHNLVYFPDLDSVRQFNTRLASIGNIGSDGRPILGLDARDLLEIVLDTSDKGFLVPAHIWTPWFSLFGSKSGFDSIVDCFEDLTPHVFAAETGLSSDPAMNWRIAELDRITLISNSDAHSPSKLGREANLFHTEMNYFALREAIEKGDKERFLGTFEFYPEEGKYHVDGHRSCDVCFTPAQTRANKGICPVCGKALTLGVLHRVEELATRPDGAQSPRPFPFHRLIPLEDLLSEIYRVGPQSKKVQQTYQTLLQELGSELTILHFLERQRIETAGVPLLGEAIARMRNNRVAFSPGYDGRFGKLKIFTDQEREQLLGRQPLFAAFEKSVVAKEAVHSSKTLQPSRELEPKATPEPGSSFDRPLILNPQQSSAVESVHVHSMIVAGPGTGKTRTVTQKIARLLENGTDGERLLAVTFTNKAAREMKERLKKFITSMDTAPFVGTFHALGYRILKLSMNGRPLTIMDEAMRRTLAADALALNGLNKGNAVMKLDAFLNWIVCAKQQLVNCEDALEEVCPAEHIGYFSRCYRTYEALLEFQGLADFEDLIFRAIQVLENEQTIADRFLHRFDHIFIDEFQDINEGQYRLIRKLAGSRAKVCVIGDPDQSIYGFRGSDLGCFNWFLKDYPEAQVFFLRQNYRSTQTILDVSAQVIKHNPERLDNGHRRAIYSDLKGEPTIHIMETPTENSEAVAIGKTIENLVGGTSFLSMDAGTVDGSPNQRELSFEDVAILVRTRRQIEPIRRMIARAGIPCQVVDRKRFMDHPGIKSLISIFKLVYGMATFHDIEIAGKIIRPSVSSRIINVFKTWSYRQKRSLEKALDQACRLPIPGVGLSQQQKLFAMILHVKALKTSLSRLSVAECLDEIISKTGLHEKYSQDTDFEGGFHQLLAASRDYPDDAERFLTALTLARDTDIYDHHIEKVSLMTMHAAKGLEFPIVFVAGCENGLIPYRHPSRPEDTEEERRLFYVALTRAKKQLFLSWAKVRRINGERRHQDLSPFVKEIEDRYKQFSQSGGKKNEKPAQEQLSLF